MTDEWLRVRECGVEVRVRLNPRSSRVRIDGFYGDRLKIRLTDPPVGGAANKALVRFLAKATGLAPSCGRVVVGTRDRSKTVLLECDEPAKVARRLRNLVARTVDTSPGRS